MPISRCPAGSGHDTSCPPFFAPSSSLLFSFFAHPMPTPRNPRPPSRLLKPAASTTTPPRHHRHQNQMLRPLERLQRLPRRPRQPSHRALARVRMPRTRHPLRCLPLHPLDLRLPPMQLPLPRAPRTFQPRLPQSLSFLFRRCRLPLARKVLSQLQVPLPPISVMQTPIFVLHHKLVLLRQNNRGDAEASFCGFVPRIGAAA